MKISVKQVGGFAGEIEHPPVDTTKLKPAAAAEFEQQLQALNFAGLPTDLSASRGAKEPIGADMGMHYELTVEDGPHKQTIKIPVDNRPETASLRQFINKVLQYSSRNA